MLARTHTHNCERVPLNYLVGTKSNLTIHADSLVSCFLFGCVVCTVHYLFKQSHKIENQLKWKKDIEILFGVSIR